MSYAFFKTELLEHDYDWAASTTPISPDKVSDLEENSMVVELRMLVLKFFLLVDDDKRVVKHFFY